MRGNQSLSPTQSPQTIGRSPAYRSNGIAGSQNDWRRVNGNMASSSREGDPCRTHARGSTASFLTARDELRIEI